METMKEKVENYLNLQNEIRIELKEYVKDKSIPLDERWELFIMCELGNNEPYIEHFNSFNDDELFAELELSRNEVVTSESIIDLLDTNIYGEYLYTTLDDVKEEILDKFITSFKLDW